MFIFPARKLNWTGSHVDNIKENDGTKQRQKEERKFIDYEIQFRQQKNEKRIVFCNWANCRWMEEERRKEWREVSYNVGAK